MKHLLAFLLLPIILTGCAATAQTGSKAKDAVITAEEARFAAQVSKDYATLDKLLGTELFYQNSNGNVDNKTSFIQSVRDGKRGYDAITLDSSAVRIYGGTAVVNGIVSLTLRDADGKPNNRQLRFSDVWVKRDRRWQLINWQAHKIDNTPLYYLVD